MIIEFPKSAKPVESKSPFPPEKRKCPACGRDANPPVGCQNKTCEEVWTHLEQNCSSCKCCWAIRLVDENCNRDTGRKCNAASFLTQQELERNKWVAPLAVGQPRQTTMWVLFVAVAIMVIVGAVLLLRAQGKTTPKTVDRTEQTR